MFSNIFFQHKIPLPLSHRSSDTRLCLITTGNLVAVHGDKLQGANL